MLGLLDKKFSGGGGGGLRIVIKFKLPLLNYKYFLGLVNCK